MKVIRMVVLALLLVAHGLTLGGIDEGVAAYNRGDYGAALLEWRPLAEQGDASAQLNLGYMYDNGYGVTEDYKEAMKWYRRAAEQGNARAQYNLGLMYEGGYGVPQNNVQAHMWYDIAGVELAVSYRDSVALRMSLEQIAEAHKLSREWMGKYLGLAAEARMHMATR